MTDGGGDTTPYLPPDLQPTDAASASAAGQVTAGSFTQKIRLPIVRNKRYTFYFTYLYQDPDTKKTTEGPRSPTVQYTFDIPNLTKPVLNLTLISGVKSYSVKFDVDPASIQTDMIFYESLTGAFAGEEYIVYVGTSTNVSINTSDFAPRWVKVVTRDNWEDANISSVIAGPVTPTSADPDTSTAPAAPSGVSASGSIDPDDYSGFSGQLNVQWNARTDTNTSGYVIRWSTQNPATVTNPLWEYGQVDGKATNKFTVTGLLPNTLYYYQVTAKSPYNAISWTSPFSGTFGPIVDITAPTDAWAQLKSILSIGGKNSDLFKFGTGIVQSINSSITTTPDLVAGTYSGIILNRSTTNAGHNYWLNTGQFRVGSASSFLYWDGANVYTTGKINATGGSFTGDVQLNGGSLYAGALPNSGARVRLNTSGVFAYDVNGVQTIAITAADGKIDARQGYIGGWTIDGTAKTVGSISKNGTILDSNGNITLGDTTGTLSSIVRLSSSDANYRIWVGSQTASNAPFRVSKTGVLTATGAVFTGYTTDAQLAAAKAAAEATAAADATTKANAARTAAVSTAATDAQTRATAAKDAAILASVAKEDFNKDAIIAKLSPTTNTTSIDGGLISTGTLKAEAVVTDFISAFEIEATKIKVGTLTGHVLQAGLTGTSYYLNTKGSKSGIDGLVVNAIGIESSRTGGVFTHWYPYYPGTTANFDLGTSSYPWNDGRFAGNIHVGYRSQDTPAATGTGASAGPRIRLYSGGPIFANTLGTGSGNSIVQDAGFLKVQTSSLRYKENVNQISKSGYLSIINSLKPVTYSYIGDTGYSGNPRVLSGLIAEDLHEIPQLRTVVNYNEENKPDGIAYDRLTASLVLAIQELSEKMDGISLRLDAIGA